MKSMPPSSDKPLRAGLFMHVRCYNGTPAYATINRGFPPLFARATMFVMHTAERVIATLRAHEAELRQAGLRSLSLFGSVARGETETDSDIDLAAEFDPAARMDLLQLTALERRIAELLGHPVDLLPEPVEKRRLQDQINRDRRRAF
jgi:predicted nucleotidyltransferase